MNSLIPRTMHHIWIGPRSLPEEFAGYRRAWAELHPTWEHRVWTNANTPLPGMVNQDAWDRAEEVVTGSVEQFRSDLLRYEILYRFGGVYVDADMEPRQPLDQLLEGVGCFAAWETEGVWINNAVMGAQAYHPFIGDLVRGLAANIEGRRQGWRPNRLSGPQYLTGLWKRNPAGVTVFPKGHFYPYLYNELHRSAEAFPEAIAVHHWNNRRHQRQEAAR
jgi:mannosyltransferase OCH1-like enzyme